MLVPLGAALGIYLVYNVLKNRTQAATAAVQGEAKDKHSRHTGKKPRSGYMKWIRTDEALDDVSNYHYNPTVVQAGETRDGNFRVDMASRYGTAPSALLM